jgi:SAM-dependent methyltransferase/uncharacterized protein YbaR (Trm112 family)
MSRKLNSSPLKARNMTSETIERLTSPVFQTPGNSLPLELTDNQTMLINRAGAVFPVVNGIPVLLSDAEQIRQMTETDWSSSSTGGDTLNFYNRIQDQDSHCRNELQDTRNDVVSYLHPISVSGPVLEIGSGKGPLQGIADNYYALDLSITALQRNIDPQYVRVCASADELPFPDNYFRCIFSIAALEHVPQVDSAFEEIDRTLKPGGVIYLLPAWHCEQYNCDGIPVRPYQDLTIGQRVTKFLLPMYRSPVFKALHAVPWRLLRRAQAWLRKRPGKLIFKRLRPDYEQFWISDSDAASRIDIHEACLFFQSRGYRILTPGSGLVDQVFARHAPLVAIKPDDTPR